MDKAVSINIGANFIGRIWLAVTGLIFVPFYIHYLGIESYGLVGFYATILGSIQILDFGLSTTLNRELSKAISEERSPELIRSLVFTLEILYVAFGALIGISIFLIAPILAENWVNSETIPIDSVTESIKLMGLVIALQWPLSLYSGGLLGIEKQVPYNIITIIFSTIRAGGVILALKFIAPTLFIFFTWQAIISFFFVFSMRISLWRFLPTSSIFPIFSINQLSSIWKFATGMTGIGLVTFFLTSIDKILLSKILTLSNFGYYVLAFTVANGIAMMVAPINLAVFPRLTALVSTNSIQELKNLYHQSCRLVSIAVIPIGLFLIFFAYQIMTIWTGDHTTADETYQMVAILVLGSIFNALLVVPYLLMLAYGWTKLTIYQNAIASVILVPLLFYWTDLYGNLGATFVWLTLNMGAFFITMPLIHKRLLKGELSTVYFKDYGIPFFVTICIISIVKLFSIYLIPLNNVLFLGITLFIYLFLIAYILPETRRMLKLIKQKIALLL